VPLAVKPVTSGGVLHDGGHRRHLRAGVGGPVGVSLHHQEGTVPSRQVRLLAYSGTGIVRHQNPDHDILKSADSWVLKYRAW